MMRPIYDRLPAESEAYIKTSAPPVVYVTQNQSRVGQGSLQVTLTPDAVTVANGYGSWATLNGYHFIPPVSVNKDVLLRALSIADTDLDREWVIGYALEKNGEPERQLQTGTNMELLGRPGVAITTSSRTIGRFPEYAFGTAVHEWPSFEFHEGGWVYDGDYIEIVFDDTRANIDSISADGIVLPPHYIQRVSDKIWRIVFTRRTRIQLTGLRVNGILPTSVSLQSPAHTPRLSIFDTDLPDNFLPLAGLLLPSFTALRDLRRIRDVKNDDIALWLTHHLDAHHTDLLTKVKTYLH